MSIFTARFAGTCVGCWDRIEPGDRVGYNRDDRVLHEGCLDGASQTEPPISAPTVACPKCWLVHPEGVCDR